MLYPWARRAWWPVTFEMGQAQRILWIREVRDNWLALVLLGWSHWEQWPNSVKKMLRGVRELDWMRRSRSFWEVFFKGLIQVSEKIKHKGELDITPVKGAWTKTNNGTIERSLSLSSHWTTIELSFASVKKKGAAVFMLCDRGEWKHWGAECGYSGWKGGRFLEPTCQRWSQARPYHNRNDPHGPKGRSMIRFSLCLIE